MTMGTTPMAAAPRVPRRSLLLAGGGMKVALQAGVMQVWLDEAGIKFDHVDGASGGCLNLAMYCQGMSGARIADNWRTLHPTAGVSVNWLQLQKLMFAKSLFTLDGYRKNVFPKWGLDWAAIRASAANATFNLYNFTKHQLEILGPELMDEDRLCSCISLPIWFPPIVLNGDNYIDAVYVTDANLEEAIRQGADELWVIWTVSTRGEWSNGFVNNYFQIIEASANGRLQQITDRVEANNLALSNGQPGEFGRPIELKVISAEVELNYLLNFTPDRVVEAVNRGVQVARQWCAENGVSLTGGAAASAPAAAPSAPISLEFSEVMRGFVTVGETDYDKGFRSGKIANKSLVVKLTIKTDDLNHFITFPQHEAEVTGSIISAQYGGVRPVIHGVFNLLVDTENPERKAMYYRLFFTDAQNNPLTLLGFKDVRNDNNSDPWTDTTTLFTRVLRGHVDPQADGGAAVVAAGIITIHLLDFMHQLTTFKLGGSSAPERAAAFARFGALFLGKLWDVYAHQILPESPF